MKITKLLLAGAFALAAASAAFGAGLYTPGLPAAGSLPSTQPFTGIETIPMDTNLANGQNPQTESVTFNQLAAGMGLSMDTWRNKLIGGDFSTNLWQRGTTSASITTALLYGPDRWWGLSGTGTAFTIIKQTGASDITTGVPATARVQRTAAQTGVLPVCVGQIMTTANSSQLQGKPVEFSFYAKTGANFSAASSQVTVTIATGTGADGSAANFSTAAWTGYAAATTQVVTLSTTFDRYSAVATIPATAVQIGVKICYTPVGTAGANDWFEFGNASLDINPALNPKTNVAASDTSYNILAFESRNSQAEAFMQRAYFWELDESATVFAVAPCAAVDVTHTNCWVQFPTPMRINPTVTYAAGFASPTTTSQATLGACTALANAATVAAAVPSTIGVLVNCTATTIPAAGVASFLYSNAGSGKIIANAEL